VTDISPTAAPELQEELSLMAESDDVHGTIYDLIEQSGFFHDLDRDEIAMLAVWVKAYSAPTGTMLLKEGVRTPAFVLSSTEKSIFLRKPRIMSMSKLPRYKAVTVSARWVSSMASLCPLPLLHQQARLC